MYFGQKPIKSAEELLDKLEYDTRLVRKRYDDYYFCIPKRIDKYNGPSQTKVIAVNPGKRSFSAGYDPDGVIVEVGNSDISRIEKLCYHYDNLQSKWSQPKLKHGKRYRCKRAGARIQRRGLLEVCLLGVITDATDEQGQRIPKLQSYYLR